MALLQPKTDKHTEIIDSVKRFAEGDDLRLPSFSGNIEKRMFEVALAVQTFYSVLDDKIDDFRTAADDTGTPIRCGEGCDHCCYEPVVGTFAESILLYLFLEKHTLAKENYNSNYSDWRKKWTKGKIEPNMEKLLQSSPEEMIKYALIVDSIYGRVACPFLIDSSCSIYEVRPTVCRRTLAFNDPELCANNSRMMILSMDVLELVGSKSRTLFGECSYKLDMNSVEHHLVPFLVDELMKGPKKCLRDYAKLMERAASDFLG